MSETRPPEATDEVDDRSRPDQGANAHAPIRLPRRRRLSPWASRRLLLGSFVVALLLIPLWLDPTTLRELRSVTPSPFRLVATPDVIPTVLPTGSPEGPVGPSVRVARDDFQRVFEHGWGTSDFGGRYSSHSEGFANLFVESGRGVVQVGTDGAGHAVLDIATAPNVDAAVSLSFDGAPLGDSSAGVVVRATDEAMYSVRIVSAGPSTSLVVELVNVGPGNDDELLAPPVALPDMPLSRGRVAHLRVQAFGSDPTTIRVRAWLDGNPEPDDWQISVIDWTGRLQLSAGVGLGWDIEDALPDGVDIAFDELEVWSTDLGGTP